MKDTQLSLDLGDWKQHLESIMKMYEPLGTYSRWAIKYYRDKPGLYIRTFVYDVDWEFVKPLFEDELIYLKNEKHIN